MPLNFFFLDRQSHFDIYEKKKQSGVLFIYLVELTSNTRDSFTTGKISNVNEGIVERSKDVSNTENELTFTNLGTESDLLNDLGGNLLVGLEWID